MNDNVDSRRLLPVEGLYNIRELGGYPAAGGKRVKWGVFFRSGDMAGITAGGRKVLEKAGIRSVVDFRTDAERAGAPDGEIGAAAKTLRLVIDGGSIIDLSRTGAETDGPALMKTLYRAMVDHARPQYAGLLKFVSEPENTPVLFHCSAGKDRTGLAAAFILSALGAGRETVIADYLLSAKYLEGKYRELIQSAPSLLPLMTVKRSYIEAALNRIDEAYGGMETYLRAELGAGLEELRRLYTE
jgi:protein-tyrosine phosphatase